MAYVSLADLKTYLGVGNTGDDTLLSDVLTRAQSIFDSNFEFSFEAETATRYYDSVYISGMSLLLDAPLLSITTLKNGDTTTIASSAYRLYPRNSTPYYEILLLDDSDVDWTFDTDGEVSIAGTWGYTTTAPQDVKNAVMRQAAYF